MAGSNYCVCCGDEIPEGRQVCPNCEKVRLLMDDVKKVTAPNPKSTAYPKVGKIRGTSRYGVYVGGSKVVMQVCKTKKQAINLAAELAGMTTKEYLKLMKGEQDDA